MVIIDTFFAPFSIADGYLTPWQFRSSFLGLLILAKTTENYFGGGWENSLATTLSLKNCTVIIVSPCAHLDVVPENTGISRPVASLGGPKIPCTSSWVMPSLIWSKFSLLILGGQPARPATNRATSANRPSPRRLTNFNQILTAAPSAQGLILSITGSPARASPGR